MTDKSQDSSRRIWLRTVAGVAASITGLRAGELLAQAAAPKRVEETEAQAAALGYKHDAAKVDKAKYANYQAGASCSKCNFFKGKPGAAQGPCDLFGGREVDAKGWCTAWVKKA
jgi:hypothetical protein